MELSARTMYGLRALTTMACARSSDPMSIQTICDRESLPQKFLEGIMVDLKRGGFVKSRRGAGGGYLMARPPSEITVLDVIRHLEGPVAPAAFEDRSGEGHMTERQRAFMPVWTEVRDATIRVLQTYTIQSIADAVEEEPHGAFHPIYEI